MTYLKITSLLFIILLSNSMSAQTKSKEKMQDLAFMVGEWVGTSTSFKDGEIKQQIPAYQKISYAVNKSIIVIDLHSESLQLHTVIYYDEKDETYYYNPYYENGKSQSPAKFKDGKLIVSPSETKRYIFQKTGDNSFQEHGEELIDGVWVKYFEDKFKDIQ